MQSNSMSRFIRWAGLEPDHHGRRSTSHQRRPVAAPPNGHLRMRVRLTQPGQSGRGIWVGAFRTLILRLEKCRPNSFLFSGCADHRLVQLNIYSDLIPCPEHFPYHAWTEGKDWNKTASQNMDKTRRCQSSLREEAGLISVRYGCLKEVALFYGLLCNPFWLRI